MTAGVPEPQSPGDTDWNAIAANSAQGAMQPTSFSSWLDRFAVQLVGGIGSDFTKSPPVYIGSKMTGEPLFHDVSTEERPDGFVTNSPQGQITSTAAALNMPAVSEEAYNETLKKMQALGFPVQSFDDVMKLWAQAVNRASTMFTASDGKNQITPWDALSMYATETGVAGTGGSQTHTQVSRSVNELTEGQSWSVLRGTLQQALGRDPSDDELRNFTYKMSTLAARNPSITKSTTTTSVDGNSSTNSHSSGGFTSDDAAEAALSDAQESPEYGAYQAATTYYNAAMNSLGAVGSVG